MTQEPTGRLDPERLKSERQNVDLGETETGHDHVSDRAHDEDERHAPIEQPTAGATPPAR